MGLGRLRRLLQDAAIYRVEADVAGRDLRALQVDGIGAVAARSRPTPW